MDGSISSPPYLLAQILKLCPVFKILAPDNETRRRIFFNVIDRPRHEETQVIARPIFLLSTDQPNGSQKVVTAASGWTVCNGTLEVVIEVDFEAIKEKYPRETNTTEELLRVWDNLVDTLTNQIIENAYNGQDNPDHQLDISRIYNIVAGRNSEAEAKTKGRCLVAMFKINWGPNQ